MRDPAPVTMATWFAKSCVAVFMLSIETWNGLELDLC